MPAVVTRPISEESLKAVQRVRFAEKENDAKLQTLRTPFLSKRRFFITPGPSASFSPGDFKLLFELRRVVVWMMQ